MQKCQTQASALGPNSVAHTPANKISVFRKLQCILFFENSSHFQ